MLIIRLPSTPPASRTRSISRRLSLRVCYCNDECVVLRELKTVGVCDRGGGYWVQCRNGQTIEGRLRVWDATGKGSGRFVVRSTSTNSPYRTMSKSLSIW
ncbi:DUF4879 domain-containing protein [Luteibacter yeojuensis]